MVTIITEFLTELQECYIDFLFVSCIYLFFDAVYNECSVVSLFIRAVCVCVRAYVHVLKTLCGFEHR